jgi:lipopolysaccharide/colanic/teichoic acid biosynthesis glycosyltransferase
MLIKRDDPERRFASKLPARFQSIAITMRPALSRMLQLRVLNDKGPREKERCVTYSIRNLSIWFDIYVLGRTIFAVLASSGAR